MRPIQRLNLTVIIFFLWLGCAAALAQAQNHPVNKGDALSDQRGRIARIENSFEPIAMGSGQQPIQLDLQQVMQISNVPGLSVAVIENYKIAWAKGYGVTETGGSTPVTTHTLFP